MHRQSGGRQRDFLISRKRNHKRLAVHGWSVANTEIRCLDIELPACYNLQLGSLALLLRDAIAQIGCCTRGYKQTAAAADNCLAPVICNLKHVPVVLGAMSLIITSSRGTSQLKLKICRSYTGPNV